MEPAKHPDWVDNSDKTPYGITDIYKIHSKRIIQTALTSQALGVFLIRVKHLSKWPCNKDKQVKNKHKYSNAARHTISVQWKTKTSGNVPEL